MDALLEKSLTVKRKDYRILEGLPKFFGGKRKLAPFILSKAHGDTFIDAFFGGGSVSLFAKAQNYKVYACDRSEHSAMIARAYLTNDRMRLDNYDVTRLFVKSENNKNYCYDRFCGTIFTERHARFIDNAATIINTKKYIKNHVRRDLLNALLIKIIFELRPYGNFTTNYMIEFFDKPYEIPESELPDKIASAVTKSVFTPIYNLAMRMKDKVNNSVFTNGKNNEFVQSDVIDFLCHVDAENVYLDPPYYGAQSYEKYYNVLDSILLQKDVVDEPSVYNGPDWKKHFHKLLSVCNKIPNWIISFGCEKITPQEFLSLVQLHRRNVELFEIPYTYSVGAGHSTGKVIEILVTARGK